MLVRISVVVVSAVPVARTLSERPRDQNQIECSDAEEDMARHHFNIPISSPTSLKMP